MHQLGLQKAFVALRMTTDDNIVGPSQDSVNCGYTIAIATSGITRRMLAMLGKFARFDGKDPELLREWSSKLKVVSTSGTRKSTS